MKKSTFMARLPHAAPTRSRVDVCVTVTLVDGFVLARSVFHHSMNYRSVVILGKARLVEDRDEKIDALRRFTNHIVPGRWDEARQPHDQELKATSVLVLPLKKCPRKYAPGRRLTTRKTMPFLSGLAWFLFARASASRYRMNVSSQPRLPSISAD